MDDQKNPRRSFRLEDYGPRVDALAKRERVKASAIVRRALAAYMDGAAAPAGTSEQLAALADQLGLLRSDLARIGGNLNQIAYAFNTDRPMSAPEITKTHADLQEQFSVLSAFLMEVRHAVRR